VLAEAVVGEGGAGAGALNLCAAVGQLAAVDLGADHAGEDTPTVIREQLDLAGTVVGLAAGEDLVPGEFAQGFRREA
jgi:hypothetical protein